MALILNIDTSGQEGFVALAKDGIYIDSLINSEPMQHAAFLQPAILQLVLKNRFVLQDLDAVAISNGPGSYTGLRVGLASAKGLCFALKKPLIIINTLQVMALAAKEKVSKNENDVTKWQSTNMDLPILFCPMIDARRMEVFFSIYDKNLQPIVEPCAAALNTDFLSALLTNNCIFFSGSGVFKWQKICNHPQAIFLDTISVVKSLPVLAEETFQQNLFADVVLTEPFYYKEFYTITVR